MLSATQKLSNSPSISPGLVQRECVSSQRHVGKQLHAHQTQPEGRKENSNNKPFTTESIKAWDCEEHSIVLRLLPTYAVLWRSHRFKSGFPSTDPRPNLQRETVRMFSEWCRKVLPSFRWVWLYEPEVCTGIQDPTNMFLPSY